MSPMEKNTCFENRQCHISSLLNIEPHTSIWNLTIRIQMIPIYQELIYLEGRLSSSEATKNVIFSLKVDTSNDFCWGNVPWLIRQAQVLRSFRAWLVIMIMGDSGGLIRVEKSTVHHMGIWTYEHSSAVTQADPRFFIIFA